MRSNRHSPRAQRIWLAVRATAAFLLLFTIFADVVGDASCDLPSLLTSAATTLRPASPEGTSEPCVTFCVPDCFCCSRSVGAAPAIAPQQPVLLTAVEPPAQERWPQGVRPVVDHPPLHLA